MTEDQFQPGDIVYHKVYDLKMVVIYLSSETKVHCRFISARGGFTSEDFYNIEVTKDTPDFIQSQLRSLAKD